MIPCLYCSAPFTPTGKADSPSFLLCEECTERAEEREMLRQLVRLKKLMKAADEVDA